MNRIFPPRAFQVNLLNNKNVKKIFLSIIFGVGVLYYKGFYFILGEHNIEPPKASHSEAGGFDLFSGDIKKWRACGEIFEKIEKKYRTVWYNLFRD